MTQSSPVDSGGIHQTPPNIYQICMLYVSWKWIICDSVRVQSGDSTRLHRTPTYLIYSQILISRGFSPADSSGLAGPPSLDNTQFFKFYIPVNSSGLRWTQYVTICDKVGVWSSPAESSRVQQSPAEHVGECKVLLFLNSHLFKYIERRRVPTATFGLS